jgi:hypothetical protein
LKELYWKDGQPAVLASKFWEDSLRYLYLPRLKNHDVLLQAIRAGATSQDFFGSAYGQANGQYEGFQFGSGTIQTDDTLLLIEPSAAKIYYEAQSAAASRPVIAKGERTQEGGQAGAIAKASNGSAAGSASTFVAQAPMSFHGTADVSPTTAKMHFVQIADEIVALLASDPNASVKVIVEISADFPGGATDTVKRAVSENARSLGLKSADWE